MVHLKTRSSPMAGEDQIVAAGTENYDDEHAVGQAERQALTTNDVSDDDDLSLDGADCANAVASNARHVKSGTSIGRRNRSLADNDQDDDDDDDDDDSMDETSSISPVGWLLLGLPIVFLALAMTIAYIGRSPKAVTKKAMNFRDGHSGGSGGFISDGSQVDDPWMTIPDLNRTQGTAITVATINTVDAQNNKDNSTTFYVTEKAAQQILNYLEGIALIINVEIANHAGNALCHIIGHARNAMGGTPSGNCINITPEDNVKMEAGYPDYYPWTRESTHANLLYVRQYFHMLSWRFTHVSSSWASSSSLAINQPVSLAATDWEDDYLLSILVIRDPLDRMLAYDEKAATLWPAVFDAGKARNHNDLQNQWWAFAQSPYTDNFALRALLLQGSGSGDPNGGCCHGAQTARKYLDRAKQLLERFTIILDMACLNEGLEALSTVLHLHAQLPRDPRPRKPPAERMLNNDVYQFLRNKNRLDIELYEWAKTRSLVSCATTSHNPETRERN